MCVLSFALRAAVAILPAMFVYPKRYDVIVVGAGHAGVEAALAHLPERQRAALWLAAVDGLSYAEVAKALETSESSVKALVHRARVALAEQLANVRSKVAIAPAGALARGASR